VSPVTPHVVLQTATINAPAGTKFTPIAIFNHGANLVGGSAAKHIPLPARRARTPKSPENEQRPRGGSPVTAAADQSFETDDDSDRPDPMIFALDSLRRDSGRQSRDSLDEELASRGYDPLQRFNIYLEASQNASKEELDPHEQRMLKVAYKELMRNILKTNRHGIRRMLHDGEEMNEAITAILGTQNSAVAAVTRRELRFLFLDGRMAKDRDKVDVPLKALSSLKGLIRVAGLDGCMKLLPGLRAHMKSGY
jgi:hypothetical protein